MSNAEKSDYDGTEGHEDSKGETHRASMDCSEGWNLREVLKDDIGH